MSEPGTGRAATPNTTWDDVEQAPITRGPLSIGDRIERYRVDAWLGL